MVYVAFVIDVYDNPLAETINGNYKAEVIHRRGPWRSFEAIGFASLEWVDWFNHRRLLEPIGNIPPAEARANYHAATAAMHKLPMAAHLKLTSLRQSRGGSSLYRRPSPKAPVINFRTIPLPLLATALMLMVTSVREFHEIAFGGCVQ